MKEDVQFEAIRERLRQRFVEDGRERLFENILRFIEDPLRPRNEEGRLRVNPALLVFALFAAIAVAAFLCFSFGGGS
jgi:hypothetical protein